MNSKNIILNDSAKIDLTCQGSLNDILIVGNFNGMFGRINESRLDLSGEPSEEIINNFMWLNDTRRDAKKVFIGTRSSVGDYVKNMMAAAENLGIQINRDKYNIILVDSDDELLNKLNEISHTMPKFDYIIQNPPYAKTLHIDFFKKGIELLNDTGKMTIIEPALWLLSILRNGNTAKYYTPFKNQVNHHIEEIVIDNLNDVFGTLMMFPFSITKYSVSEVSEIKVKLFSETKNAKSIFDVNLFGNHKIMNSIIDKCLSYKTVAAERFNNDKINSHYVKCVQLLMWGNGYFSQPDVADDILGTRYYAVYTDSMLNHKFKEIYDKEPITVKGRSSNFIAGTKEELTNWIYYVTHNTLPIFLNVIMPITQTNNSLKYIPWLVDKQYTDQEIYEMFHFTEQEINLIEYTVEKFQYSSPFFKRYMCGPSKVSDQEVQEYINQLKKKHNIDY